MAADYPTILPTSGGYKAGTRAPRMAQVGTASGDQRWFNNDISEAARVAGFDLSHLNLFPMPNVADMEAHLLAQDMVWVNGGSVANLLAVWRIHGLDVIFRRVWEAGVVLAGVSAGSICWFEGGTTDSFGPGLRAVTNGLGLLPYSNGVHHDSEKERRPLVHKLVADGTFGITHCTDDGVGLVYRGTQLADVVTEIPGKSAYIVTLKAGEGPDAVATERRLDARLLG